MKITDFKIGQKAEIKHKITRDDLEKFVDLTGDDNPLHLDEDFAGNTSFKKPVVHGMLGASFISTIIGTKLPGPGALWFSQNIEFLLPVRIGDEIQVLAEVLKIDKRQNILELSTNIYNQHKNQVVAGKAKVKLIEQEKKPISKKNTKIIRNILIIGSTGGIGTALVNKLSDRQDLNFALHYHSNAASAKTLQKKLKSRSCMLVTCDLRDAGEVNEMCRNVYHRLGGLDIVVNCATGHVPNIDFKDLDWEDFENHLNVHVKGSFNLLKAASPYMEKGHFGKFINITTQAIEYPFSNLMPYITAKSALMGLSKSAALDLAKKGIRVNMVSPGITDTELNADLPEKVKLVTEARTPLKKLAQPEDVANVLDFLVSESSNFITGETIRLNGGQIMI
jgi:3-oxoacyl-[acyl-carrier protein] reductase